MKNEVKSLLKKNAKIAGVTCVAAGAVALVSSKAALQAVLKGSEYFKDAVKKIVEEPDEEEAVAETVEIAEEPIAGPADLPEETPEAVVAEEEAAE